ncbi:MAG: DUF2917 domain-containing protein [Candidatus Protistobacter heckmanni]|nr:DUF2917 domain-containing protein [Candidatus Protistobacter heckmanni]
MHTEHLKLRQKQIAVRLDHRAAALIRTAPGAEVRCLRGELWVTLPSRAEDLFLNAGDVLRFASGEEFVVNALRGEAEFRVEYHDSRDAAPRRWRAALARLFGRERYPIRVRLAGAMGIRAA